MVNQPDVSTPDGVKEIQVQYYALLREERGVSGETLNTLASTPRHLYDQLSRQYRFTLPPERLTVSINNEFQSWDTELRSRDTVVFIPPVAGG